MGQSTSSSSKINENKKAKDDVGDSGSTIINRKCVLIKAPADNEPFSAAQHSEIQTETIHVDQLAPNHVVVQIHAVTIDAFIRVMLHPADHVNGGGANKVHGAIEVGQVIPAVAIGTVVQSQSQKFPVGRTVSGLLGGQTYATVPDAALMSVLTIPGVSRYKSLNLLGLSGITAHVGLHRVLTPPRRGETVVVTAAAGATGSIAVQLAKSRGARVIGVAGGPTKCQMLLTELGVDGAIDYKDTKRSLHDQFVEHCPNGIDFLFDNVGGECLNEALAHLAKRGRVVICGAISQYNSNNNNNKELKQQPGGGAGPSNYIRLAEQSATMAGFVVLDYPLGMVMAITHLAWLYFSNQIKSFEQVYHGIDQFPKALQALFEGGNIGKPIVALDDI
jgi:NADPH-dependent curcumin reductase